jgi:DNA-binding transcriptional LysR family regulator
MSRLPEWTDLRYFLELARTGTLSGTARRLAVDHTTVARRIARLETELATALFEHRREGYALTEAGQSLLSHAETMEGAVLAAAEQLGGPQGAAHGTVRLGAPEVLGTLVVTPNLGRLYAEHPDLQVELLLPPRFANLANREADLGITLDRPQGGRYVVTRLTDFDYYLYASPAYLVTHPAIRRREDLAGHDFVDYVQDQLMSADLKYLDELTGAPRRRFCCTGMLAQYQAVAAGLGLAMLTPYTVPPESNLVRVLPQEVRATRTFWLVAPTELYRLRRVRVVWDFLREIIEATPRRFRLD